MKQQTSELIGAKNRIRETLESSAIALSPGKIAEALRRERCYREADTLFVGPAQILGQIRINALADGKNLIMPSAGLKDGFFRLHRSTIPFARIRVAVTPKGLSQCADRLSFEQLAEQNISILISDALAVDQAGTRIGHGQGFFDLACALLAETQSLAPGYSTLAVLPHDHISNTPLPRDPWDVPVSGILAEAGIRHLSPAPHQPEILWHALSPGRIRKIAPLWQLHSRR